MEVEVDWFRQKFESICEKIEFARMDDKVIFGVIAGCVAGAALIAPVAIVGITAAEGVVAYSAYKFGRDLIKKLSKDPKAADKAMECLDPETREMASEFVADWRTWVNAAVHDGSVWLVRKEGASGYQKMNESQFSKFEARLADRGETLNKVVITGEKVSMMRIVAGKMHGVDQPISALRVVNASGTNTEVFADHGLVQKARDPSITLGATPPTPR